jgi:uncharacterized protein (DUF362 family)/Pyruvate/2-oxoacid:ferredoxin oxidoreductase delta subunit
MSRARVAIVRCGRYEEGLVADKVREAFDLIGGLGAFVGRGRKVLVKPNMLSAKAPEAGITTHPLVLEAVVREAQALGAEVSIGDSPSGALKTVRGCWEKTGFLDVSERTGAPLVGFEAGGTAVRAAGQHRYHLARPVLEADVVINLPKFKTHGFALFTGAIKNCYGVLPGYQKATLHKLHPHPTDFSARLVDVYAAVRPALTLMDGVVGMEGNGPATGDLRPVGLLLASADGVALDAVAAAVMGFREGEVDAIRIAGERSLGASRLADIEIAGESLESARIPDFRLPSNHLMKALPPAAARWLGRRLGRFIWVRPQSDPDRCTGCAICARACPVQAIRMENGKPVTDYRLCINCMCCNESCPEGAIVQQLSWLARRLG